MKDQITIRRARPYDARDLSRLAALDEGETPAGDSLLAFVDGELRAALPLGRGRALADPFHYTADVVDLLRLYATQEHRTGLHRAVA